MREEDSNWFAKWEEELPSPEELMPLSQTLITPDLALAFDIQNPNTPRQHQQHQPLQQQQQTPAQPNSSAEFESGAGGAVSGGGGGAGGGGGDEPARTLKRPRLVWTPQLHKRFVDAVAHLGIKNAVPKTIMQLMSVDGLTRENVASHLQKYRLYLKRMQGINSANGNGNGNSGVGNVNVNVVDPATDHLFASSPVPAHFLRPNSDHFMPYVPVTGLQQHHHHSQMAVVGQQFRHFGNSTPNGQFDHPFLARQQPPQVQRMGTNSTNPVMPSSYAEGMESPNTAANGRKVLTLFPTGED